MTDHQEGTDPEDMFSIYDFKKWMSEHAMEECTSTPIKKGIGVEVESRVGMKRLVAKMQPEEGETLELAKEFKDNGGKILDRDGIYMMIEVANGTFIIPRSCVRKKD